MPPSPDDPAVLIFTDQRDWHLRRLTAALGRRGLTPVVASLSDCAFEIGAPEPIRIPGLGDRLPRAVMVRGISAGSFEAITLRLGILHELEAMGVTVWNPPRAVERCVDKGATSVALVRAGLPTPHSLVTEDRARAIDFASREIAAGGAAVLKPLFGSQGKGLRLLRSVDDLPDRDIVGGVFYIQRYIPSTFAGFRDYRVFVSGGRVVAGMMRVGAGWVTNVHQGATPESWRVGPEAARLALAAARAVGAAFAGVDLIEDGDRGLCVLEVNSMPAWHGLQKVAGCDVADALVGDWLAASGISAREPAAVPA
jgi:tetrahydromethanopterin:alpha-L-glutamate ligase